MRFRFEEGRLLPSRRKGVAIAINRTMQAGEHLVRRIPPHFRHSDLSQMHAVYPWQALIGAIKLSRHLISLLNQMPDGRFGTGGEKMSTIREEIGSRCTQKRNVHAGADRRRTLSKSETPLTTYRVSWEIDVDAATPEDAARTALQVQRDSNSTALVFRVRDGRRTHTVDMLKRREVHCSVGARLARLGFASSL